MDLTQVVKTIVQEEVAKALSGLSIVAKNSNHKMLHVKPLAKAKAAKPTNGEAKPKRGRPKSNGGPSVKTQITEFLTHLPAGTTAQASEIATSTGLAANIVASTLSRMAKGGFIDRHGRGTYSLSLGVPAAEAAPSPN